MPFPRPWLAALLSILLPGLGLFYAGERRRGLPYTASAIVLLMLLLALRLIPPVPATVASLFAAGAVFLVVVLLAAVQAYRAARCARAEGRTRPRPLPVLLVLIASTAMNSVVLHLPDWLGRAFYTFDIPSGSMLPGLPVGSRLFASQGPAPERGHLMFYHPNRSNFVYVKRIVGLAGDRVRLTGGRLFVNGQPAAASDPGIETLDGRSYAILPMSPDAQGPQANMPEQTVPAGAAFVLGDHRNDSMDSRFPQHGPVPLDRVVAVGGVLYWLPGTGPVLRQLD